MNETKGRTRSKMFENVSQGNFILNIQQGENEIILRSEIWEKINLNATTDNAQDQN